MQAGGGGCDRARFAREDRLVPLAIEVHVRPLDVGRQRDVADGFDGVRHRSRVARPEPDEAAAEEALFQHLAVNRAPAPLEAHAPARPHPLARVDKRLPVLVVNAREQQDLDAAPAGLAFADEPRREDPGVVEDHQVAGAEQAAEVGHGRVGHRAALRSSEQPRRPNCRRVLRDEFGGQVEGEVSDPHLIGSGRF